MNTISILVVEDDASFALEIEMMIAELGYRYLGNPRTSTQALQAIAKEKPDLIIMDVNIEGDIDGIGVAQKIKSINLPVIFITGFEDTESFERAQNTFHTAYLIKPFHLLTLRSAIEKALLDTRNPSNVLKEEKGLLLKNNNTLHKIPFDEIIYVEVDGNYCYFFTAEKKFALKLSMKKVSHKINQQDKFIQIHRKYLVHKKQITNYNAKDRTIRILDHDLPVGRYFKDNVMDLLKENFN